MKFPQGEGSSVIHRKKNDLLHKDFTYMSVSPPLAGSIHWNNFVVVCLFLLPLLNYWLNNLVQAVLDWDWDWDFFLRRIQWICFSTNRWVCIIWETHKDGKHCEDQERRLNKYFLSLILIIVHFYIALFSTLEQTHYAVVPCCDSERVTASSQNIPGLPSGSPAANRYFSSYNLQKDL